MSPRSYEDRPLGFIAMPPGFGTLLIEVTFGSGDSLRKMIADSVGG
jgi:hypothetical protein